MSMLSTQKIFLRKEYKDLFEAAPQLYSRLKPLQSRFGYEFRDINLLINALTHKSMPNLPNNERLEFYGDAVLNMHITQRLMDRGAEQNEGRLSKARANLVNNKLLAEIARELDFGECIIAGDSLPLEKILSNDNILADTVEAVIGAVAKESGPYWAGKLIETLYGDRLDSGMDELAFGIDSRSELQELLQGRGVALPEYHFSEFKPDVNAKFGATVYIQGDCSGGGFGRTKKEAAQNAAKKALEIIKGYNP